MTTERELELLAAIALKDEAIKPFVSHKSYCAIWLTEKQNPMGGICNCGLDIARLIQPDATALAEYIEPLVNGLEWALGNINCEPFEWCCEEDSDAHRGAIEALAKVKGEQK